MLHVAPNILESEQDKSTRRKLRARIGCELLLAELFKHHKNHAGIEYRVVDLEPPEAPEQPPSAPIVVLPVAVQPDSPMLDDCPTIKEIVHAVSAFYQVSVLDICSQRRHYRTTLPRQICMYLARHLTLASFATIGQAIGRRDHTTALHGAGRVGDMILDNSRIADEIDVLKLHIRQTVLNRAA